MQDLLETINHVIQLTRGTRYKRDTHAVRFERAIKLLQLAVRHARTPGLKPIIQPVINELQSVLSVLNSGYDLAPAPRLTELDKAKRILSKKIQDAIRGEEQKEADSEDDEVHAIEEMIRRNAVEAPKIQLGNKPFAIHKAPIVITSPADVSKLNRTGFKAEYMSGYVVLHNQTVVGVSARAAQGSSFIEEAEAILATYSKVRRTRYRLVSDQAYRYSGAAWFWAASERDIDAIRRAMGGSINITDWGFSFR